MVTFSHATDWHVQHVIKLIRCEHCGGIRRALSGPHGPRHVEGRLVDCRGREIHMEERKR